MWLLAKKVVRSQMEMDMTWLGSWTVISNGEG